MTPAVTTHGDGFAEPFSKPSLANICVVVPPPPEVTVRLSGVERVRPPPLPLICTLYVPATVDAPTVIVSEDEPEPGAGMGAGLKFAVAPEGSPLADNATEELNPPETVAVIVELPEPPTAILSDAGDAAIEKLGDAPPDVVTDSEKSSNTNDVLRLEFSTPTR